MSGGLYRTIKRWLTVAGWPSYLMVALVVVTLCGPLVACNKPTPEPQVSQVQETQSGYAGKKILFVDSYHDGYEWSDGIYAGIQDVLGETGVELKVVRMDTKRNTEEEFRVNAAEKAKAEIASFGPDVLIAADDNAQKYLVVPHFKDTGLPVVFCGVNWDASPYGYPASNVTGMVEVELPDRLIGHLKEHAAGDRVGYVTVDSVTERKTAKSYNELFFDGEMVEYWAKTWDEFKDAFLRAQKEVDIVFIGNNAGIDRWDKDEAAQFMLENAKVPTGSINDWMAPYALITLAKSAHEQGEWAAETALRILEGTSPADIPVVKNKEEVLILNLELAEKLGVVFAPSILKVAKIQTR